MAFKCLLMFCLRIIWQSFISANSSWRCATIAMNKNTTWTSLIWQILFMRPINSFQWRRIRFDWTLGCFAWLLLPSVMYKSIKWHAKCDYAFNRINLFRYTFGLSRALKGILHKMNSVRKFLENRRFRAQEIFVDEVFCDFFHFFAITWAANVRK